MKLNVTLKMKKEICECDDRIIFSINVFTGLDQGIIQRMAATRAAGTTLTTAQLR